MEFKIYRGSDIEHIIAPLAALRIAIFRDFPYLYHGDMNYEQEYLKTYINSVNALVFTISNNNEIIGATTCIPLIDETDEVKVPFLKNGYPIEKIFYFGESLLYTGYRGRGFGHLFFDEREKYVKSFDFFEFVTFCAVQRPLDHPLKPEKYSPLDKFWSQRGYHKEENLKTDFSWKDIGENQESPKKMQFWLKRL